MKNNSFLKIIVDVLKNGFKDRQTLGKAIILPIIILIIMGYMVIMVGTGDHMTIGIVNEDSVNGNINASTSIIEKLKEQENITVVDISQNDVNNALKNRTIDAAVIFPMNFGQKNAKVSLVLEGTDQSKSLLINKALTTAITQVTASSANSTQSLTINVTSLYGNGLSFANLFMFRFMTFIVLILSTAIALPSILKYKCTKMFKRMSTSPIKIALAYTLSLSIFGFITVPIVLAYIIYIMGLTIVGNIGDTILLMLLISLVGTVIGVFASTITHTKNQAFGLFGIIVVLQVIFSGLFIPVTRFDYYTQLLSYCLPLTYGLDAMKSVIIRGFSLGDVRMDLIALVTIFFVALVLSIIGLKAGQNQQRKIRDSK